MLAVIFRSFPNQLLLTRTQTKRSTRLNVDGATPLEQLLKRHGVAKQKQAAPSGQNLVAAFGLIIVKISICGSAFGLETLGYILDVFFSPKAVF